MGLSPIDFGGVFFSWLHMTQKQLHIELLH